MKLRITSQNCMIHRSKYDLYVNEKSITDLIKENLPQIEEYKKHIGNVSIEIKIEEFDSIDVITKGYEVDQPSTNETNESSDDEVTVGLERE